MNQTNGDPAQESSNKLQGGLILAILLVVTPCFIFQTSAVIYVTWLPTYHKLFIRTLKHVTGYKKSTHHGEKRPSIRIELQASKADSKQQSSSPMVSKENAGLSDDWHLEADQDDARTVSRKGVGTAERVPKKLPSNKIAPLGSKLKISNKPTLSASHKVYSLSKSDRKEF